MFREYRLFEKLNYPEDYDLCFKWMKNEFVIKGIPETTLFWREHPERTSRNSEKYNQTSFFQLKINHFLENYNNGQSVGIIGFGKKGKLCVKILQEKNVKFNVYDLNFTQFSNSKIKVLPPERISDEVLLIARYPSNLDGIIDFLSHKNYTIGINAFWIWLFFYHFSNDWLFFVIRYFNQIIAFF